MVNVLKKHAFIWDWNVQCTCKCLILTCKTEHKLFEPAKVCPKLPHFFHHDYDPLWREVKNFHLEIPCLLCSCYEFAGWNMVRKYWQPRIKFKNQESNYCQINCQPATKQYYHLHHKHQICFLVEWKQFYLLWQIFQPVWQ